MIKRLLLLLIGKKPKLSISERLWLNVFTGHAIKLDRELPAKAHKKKLFPKKSA